MEDLGDILKQREQKDSSGYISQEFQDYGYRLALKLDDLQHKALYIKLAKEEDRRLIEEALNFTLDYPEARSKAKIFMWKLHDLKKSAKGGDLG